MIILYYDSNLIYYIVLTFRLFQEKSQPRYYRKIARLEKALSMSGVNISLVWLKHNSNIPQNMYYNLSLLVIILYISMRNTLF